MNTHVIDITEDGTVSAMHNDKFNIGFLGPQKITRASDIRFHEDTQDWQIWLFVGELTHNDDGYIHSLVSGFPTYESARKFEVKWLNEARLQSLAINSEDAWVLGCNMKKEDYPIKEDEGWK